jgi:hypothetical protein
MSNTIEIFNCGEDQYKTKWEVGSMQKMVTTHCKSEWSDG